MSHEILHIRQFGDPILRQRTSRIVLKKMQSVHLRRVIRRMFRTLRKASGAGLAAQQVGYLLRLAVVDVRSKRTKRNALWAVLLNPVIVSYSKSKVQSWEGCLSLPGVRGKVPRAKRIRTRYWDASAMKCEEEVSGYHALVFQHETDHLNGVLFVDRLKDVKSLMSEKEFRERIS